jgi:hypothetical protein
MLAKTKTGNDGQVEGADAKPIMITGKMAYHMVQFLRVKWGKLSFERFRREFENDTGKVIDEHALATKMVPLEFQLLLTAKALDFSDDGPRPGQEEELKEMIIYVAKMETSSTLIKMFMKHLSVESLLNKLIDRYDSFLSAGRLEIVKIDTEAKVLIIRLSDLGEWPWYFWKSTDLFFGEILGAFGTRNVYVTNRPLMLGDKLVHEVEMHWDR